MDKFVVGVITSVACLLVLLGIFWYKGDDARNKNTELKKQTENDEWQSKQAELKSISDKQKEYCNQVNNIPVKDVEAAKDCQYSH